MCAAGQPWTRNLSVSAKERHDCSPDVIEPRSLDLSQVVFCNPCGPVLLQAGLRITDVLAECPFVNDTVIASIVEERRCDPGLGNKPSTKVDTAHL